MPPGVLGWPTRWWARQSLRARLTLIATALFAVAVATGAILVITLQRVRAHDVGNRTVLVVTDLSRVDDSIRVLTRAALIGGPVAVLLMGGATYLVVALTLRPVASLRYGASAITATGLAHNRLPVP